MQWDVCCMGSKARREGTPKPHHGKGRAVGLGTAIRHRELGEILSGLEASLPNLDRACQVVTGKLLITPVPALGLGVGGGSVLFPLPPGRRF